MYAGRQDRAVARSKETNSILQGQAKIDVDCNLVVSADSVGSTDAVMTCRSEMNVIPISAMYVAKQTIT